MRLEVDVSEIFLVVGMTSKVVVASTSLLSDGEACKVLLLFCRGGVG